MRVILSARKGHSSSEKFTLFKRGPAFPTFAASNERERKGCSAAGDLQVGDDGTHPGRTASLETAEAAGEQKAPAVQRLYRLHTKALSAWSTFGSATRICGAFATLVRNHPNWIVVLGGEKSFWLICARALAAANSIVHED